MSHSSQAPFLPALERLRPGEGEPLTCGWNGVSWTGRGR